MISLRIVDFAPNMQSSIETGEVDLAIVTRTSAIRPELMVDTQFTDRIVGVGARNHPLASNPHRATLRISAQRTANWLAHGVCSADDVNAALKRMALKVDIQNQGDPAYCRMSGNEATSLAFEAARALIFEGAAQPKGYTEPLLHRFRTRVKQAKFLPPTISGSAGISG